MSQATTLHDLIEQLEHKSSPTRRAAAKKLRKLKAVEAGPALLTALKNELQDKRTWETQYQIIMALGESGYTESLGFLTQLAEQKFEAAMIYLAIGDAIARLTYSVENSIHSMIKHIEDKNNEPLFIDGILRAIAMLKVIPSEQDINWLISYASSPETHDNNRTWIASASAGWLNNKNVSSFLKGCIESNNQQTKRAAEAALKKKYIKWSVL